jgi:hypothetical protein
LAHVVVKKKADAVAAVAAAAKCLKQILFF